MCVWYVGSPLSYHFRQVMINNNKLTTHLKKLNAHFANHVGYVDGMLVWIDRPSEKAHTGCNVVQKYFCD